MCTEETKQKSLKQAEVKAPDEKRPLRKVIIAKPLQTKNSSSTISESEGKSGSSARNTALSIGNLTVKKESLSFSDLCLNRSISHPVSKNVTPKFICHQSSAAQGKQPELLNMHTLVGYNHSQFNQPTISRQFSDPYMGNIAYMQQPQVVAQKPAEPIFYQQIQQQGSQTYNLYINPMQGSSDQISQQGYSYYGQQPQPLIYKQTRAPKPQKSQQQEASYQNYNFNTQQKYYQQQVPQTKQGTQGAVMPQIAPSSPPQVQQTQTKQAQTRKTTKKQQMMLQQQQKMQQQQQQAQQQQQQQVQQMQHVPFKINEVTQPIDQIPQNIAPHYKSDIERPPIVNFTDSTGRVFKFCCTCKTPVNEGSIIQCHVCRCFMHYTCFNIAREDPNKPFICPFCLNQKLQCRCNNNMNYTVPLIQCTRCGHWVHKQCENVGFGKTPQNFVCSKCCPGERYHLPTPEFTTKDAPYIMSCSCDRFDLISIIPDGSFRAALVEDFIHFELHFADMLKKYVVKFGELLYTGNNDFWKVFVEVFTHLFEIQKEDLYNCIDLLFYRMLYRSLPQTVNGQPRRTYHFLPYSHSESITEFIKDPPCQQYEKHPKGVKIYLDGDGVVKVSESVADNEYICDLPGFILHIDEIDANQGIPDTVISIHDTDVAVDMDGSIFDLAPKIKRSLHPNCLVKFYKVKTELRVGIFCARLASPNEDKPPRDPTILANHPLKLPFDFDLPYLLEKTSWREKKTRTKSSDSLSSIDKKKKNKKEEEWPHISLLDSFLKDTVPALPLSISLSKDTLERKKHLFSSN